MKHEQIKGLLSHEIAEHINMQLYVKLSYDTQEILNHIVFRFSNDQRLKGIVFDEICQDDD